MLFNSFAFLLFFPIVTALYFALPHRARWALLLGASCVFYMWFVPVYLLILGGTIVVDYWAGILIEQSKGRQRRLWLAASIVANVGVLAVFKYYGFLNANLEALSTALGWNAGLPALEILLPIGLSFHTFQAMSYTIEVYRGHQPAERHFGIYALYVMFYPQLVAGPIERPQNLLPQFHREQFFDYPRVTSGLRLMTWGLIKKVVVADSLAAFANPVFANPELHTAPVLALAAGAFAYQIYYDFSGYSDIAIGSARVMGIDLMRNFNRPYAATSINDFWRRWHISLSTWFRDYLYIPLGGNRLSKLRHHVNLAIVFLVSGLWHGANWTFVVWGGLHAAYLTMGTITQPWRERLLGAVGIGSLSTLRTAVQIAVTFALVSVGWIFFRAETMQHAWQYLHGLRGSWELVAARSDLLSLVEDDPTLARGLALGLMGILVVEVLHTMQTRFDLERWLLQQPWWLRGLAYEAALALLIFGYSETSDQFIYFQF